MDTLPLVTLALLGAYHGLNPAMGWLFAVGLGMQDRDRRSVLRAGQAVELTQKDFDLAVFLFRNVGNLVSRGHILESVWGRSPDLNTRTVDTHVRRIRSKLRPFDVDVIETVHGLGYRAAELPAEP